MYRATTIFWLI
ncbi:putative membrane protein, partial [Vibrio parahaemolyticus AQ3810]